MNCYLCIYQSSKYNKLPQSDQILLCFAQHFQSLCKLLTCLCLTLCYFGLLRTSSRSACCRNLSCFVLLNTSSYCAHSWLVSISTVRHLESLCSLYICFCLNVRCFVLLDTSSRSARLFVSVSIFYSIWYFQFYAYFSFLYSFLLDIYKKNNEKTIGILLTSVKCFEHFLEPSPNEHRIDTQPEVRLRHFFVPLFSPVAVC